MKFPEHYEKKSFKKGSENVKYKIRTQTDYNNNKNLQPLRIGTATSRLGGKAVSISPNLQRVKRVRLVDKKMKCDLLLIKLVQWPRPLTSS